jgi:hypothetical protein
MLKDVRRTVDPTLPRYGTDFIADTTLSCIVRFQIGASQQTCLTLPRCETITT